jgi:class 3 adenylate cyclase
MGSALERHDRIVQDAIADHGGYLFATRSDGFAGRVRAGCRRGRRRAWAQAALRREAWPPEAPIRVRMAVHTSEVLERGGNYFGTPVTRRRGSWR